MGDKEEVLEAVLKETVDLVIDLNRLLSSPLPCFCFKVCDFGVKVLALGILFVFLSAGKHTH